MNSQAYAEVDNGSSHSWNRGRSEKKPWSIYEIGAVVGGFAVFWPVGLLALFLKLKKGEIWKGASEMQAPWSSWKSPSDAAQHFSSQWKSKPWAAHAPTGNEAFDEYRKAKIEELEAMRRKLDDERKEFDTFLAKLRKIKDKEDFDRFMADRSAPQS